jgi:cyanate permease
VGTVFARGNALALTLISVSMFLTYVASSASWATVPIAAPSHFTASLGSIQNFGGYLGGALAPMLTGFIVQRTGSFSLALLLAAGLTLVTASAYLALVGDPIQVDPPVLSNTADSFPITT